MQGEFEIRFIFDLSRAVPAGERALLRTLLASQQELRRLRGEPRTADLIEMERALLSRTPTGAGDTLPASEQYRALVRGVLEEAGSISEAVRLLGMPRPAVLRWMRILGVRMLANDGDKGGGA